MPRKRDHLRNVHGILLLDKPTGRTSNQVLQSVKRLFRAAKAGHTGSLDPLATGMLPICFGAATRISSFLLGARKSYSVTAKLGTATDSGDAEGTITAKAGRSDLDTASVRRILEGFVGESEQVPPMHSALKHPGRRLYELARQGVEVERPPRPVHIAAIELLAYDRSELQFTVTCSKGTYIRTLVEDIAREMGTLGHVIALRRTAVEPFQEPDMVSIQSLGRVGETEGLERLDELLRPVDSPLSQWPRLVLQEELCDRLNHGQTVPALSDWPTGWVRLYSQDDVLFGLGEVESAGQLVPRRIFPGLSSWN